MANYHFSVHPNVSRGQGQSLVRTAAYNARTRLTDERTGKVWDYRRYGGVLFEGIYAPPAPAWARDLGQLVNEIERSEKRRDAQLAMNIDIALPHELTCEQNRRLLQDFVREQFMRHGYVAHAVIHAPEPAGDPRNIHAHILVSLRQIGPAGFVRTKAEQQERYRSRGEFVEGLREKWETLTNRHLARNGSDARIDRRSYQRQGKDQTPGQHRGPVLTAMERRSQVMRATDDTPPLQPPAALDAVAPAAPKEPASLITAPVVPSIIADQSAPEPQTSDMLDELTITVPTVHDPPPEPRPTMPAPATITGMIKGVFRAAARAVAKRITTPRSSRKRREETEGEFRKLAQNLSRPYHDMRKDFRARAAITKFFLAIPAEVYATATAYLADTFDQLSRLDDGTDQGGDPGAEYDSNQQRIFPQP